MKKALENAIEASKHLCVALEAGEIDSARALVEARDQYIRALPQKGTSANNKAAFDDEFEILFQQLMELDKRIEILAKDRSKQTRTEKTESTQNKITKHYKP